LYPSALAHSNTEASRGASGAAAVSHDLHEIGLEEIGPRAGKPRGATSPRERNFASIVQVLLTIIIVPFPLFYLDSKQFGLA
jgi:hypothetical protein